MKNSKFYNDGKSIYENIEFVEFNKSNMTYNQYNKILMSPII